jgi:hypothetical protein
MTDKFVSRPLSRLALSVDMILGQFFPLNFFGANNKQLLACARVLLLLCSRP